MAQLYTHFHAIKVKYVCATSFVTIYFQCAFSQACKNKLILGLLGFSLSRPVQQLSYTSPWIPTGTSRTFITFVPHLRHYPCMGLPSLWMEPAVYLLAVHTDKPVTQWSFMGAPGPIIKGRQCSAHTRSTGEEDDHSLSLDYSVSEVLFPARRNMLHPQVPAVSYRKKLAENTAESKQ